MTNKGLKSTKEEILNDLEFLRNGHVFELVNKPGIPKCSTLANRIEENFSKIVSSYESTIIPPCDFNKFELLSGMLNRLYHEIVILSKKQPDALINTFKTAQINKVLNPLMELMKREESSKFLTLVSEPVPESNTDKSRNTYSDAALILSQFKEACNEYEHKYYNNVV